MSYIPGLRDATWYNYAIKRKVISERIALIYFIYFFTFLTNLTTGEQVIKRVFQLKYEYKSNKMLHCEAIEWNKYNASEDKYIEKGESRNIHYHGKRAIAVHIALYEPCFLWTSAFMNLCPWRFRCLFMLNMSGFMNFGFYALKMLPRWGSWKTMLTVHIIKKNKTCFTLRLK